MLRCEDFSFFAEFIFVLLKVQSQLLNSGKRRVCAVRISVNSFKAIVYGQGDYEKTLQ